LPDSLSLLFAGRAAPAVDNHSFDAPAYRAGDGILRQNRWRCSFDGQRSYCLTEKITKAFQMLKVE